VLVKARHTAKKSILELSLELKWGIFANFWHSGPVRSRLGSHTLSLYPQAIGPSCGPNFFWAQLRAQFANRASPPARKGEWCPLVPSAPAKGRERAAMGSTARGSACFGQELCVLSRLGWAILDGQCCSSCIAFARNPRYDPDLGLYKKFGRKKQFRGHVLVPRSRTFERQETSE
jgi:hypothetical protein